ncbi:hypothetical protein SAMN05444008_10735 [Cnuella takakiae]|uniref:Amidohydrolase 3 domain-containing protein n=1 Tax=Cnuella takakiae TaxID=1302690 RepID=A0A1M5AWZ0_9BACT|nr:amidohydrolase [Cnuella takakiae]OLY93250.1 hydrolase [Cnuella takakiae]SHF34587.1 hypothetical protein SAMN05444008_10735 [Cnuella takakiae]
MKYLLLCATACLLFACNNNETKVKSFTTNAAVQAAVYYNGDILTMEGDTPQYAEAIAIKDGKILYLGSKEKAMKMAGSGHRMVDLQGHTLLPGFIDAHGHAFGAGFQKAAANLLPPPDGEGTDIPVLVRVLKKWNTDNTINGKAPAWIVGFGYDESQLKKKRHPTATELDQVSTTVPVLLLHQSGHLAAVNHKVLELANYTAETPDPEGGIIRREKDGKTPNGVLEETAAMSIMFELVGKLDAATNDYLALSGIDAYTRFGFTTIQEGAASPNIYKTWLKLAQQGKVKADIAIYPVLIAARAFMLDHGIDTAYSGHVRIAGVKIVQDGSPQGKTAYLTQPYKVPPPGMPHSYRGYPTLKQQQLDSLIDLSFANKWPLLVHCNGDAAAEMMINGVSKAIRKNGAADYRPVMIHAQTARYDQLDQMKALGIIPSFFSMHTYYWGDWHRDETLGKERAYRISPAATAIKKGMLYTEHHDAPVGLPSSIMIMATAVNRTSRTGAVIGADEKISPYQAICAITKNAAYQHFEENKKGTLKAGKLADLVILDKNPLKIPAPQLFKLQVLETIKEGKTIYSADSARKKVVGNFKNIDPPDKGLQEAAAFAVGSRKGNQLVQVDRAAVQVVAGLN